MKYLAESLGFWYHIHQNSKGFHLIPHMTYLYEIQWRSIGRSIPLKEFVACHVFPSPFFIFLLFAKPALFHILWKALSVLPMASTGVKIDEFWKKIWAQNGLRIILVCDLGISVIISIVRGPSFKVLQTAVKLLDAAHWKHHILLSKLNKKWNLTYYLLLLIIYGYITITIRYIWLGHCFFSGPSDTFRPSNLPN